MAMATATVGSELLNEIERVSAKRERWNGYMRDVGSMGAALKPAMFLMTAAIDRAKSAIQSNDPAEAIGALEDLRTFDDND